MSDIEVVDDRQVLIDHFQQDPPIHVYGLADLGPGFWSHSRWWRRGEAFVGRVPLPGPEDVVAIYAIAPHASEETSMLVRDLRPELPRGALVVGPLGSDDVMSEVSAIDRLGSHVKMTVVAESFVPSSEIASVDRLTLADLPALLALYDTDPGAAFFLPSMLEGGVFVGVREGNELLAAGGTHVRCDEFNVAALGGILTSPPARGRGLGAAVTSVLTEILLDEGRLVGLNTHVENGAARRVYQRLGFHDVHTYTEFVLGDQV